jgi:hypothetical protein
MSGREYAQLIRMSRMSKVQEECLGVDPHLFIELPNEIKSLLYSWADWTLRLDEPQRSVTLSLVAPMATMCSLLNLSHQILTVT